MIVQSGLCDPADGVRRAGGGSPDGGEANVIWVGANPAANTGVRVRVRGHGVRVSARSLRWPRFLYGKRTLLISECPAAVRRHTEMAAGKYQRNEVRRTPFAWWCVHLTMERHAFCLAILLARARSSRLRLKSSDEGTSSDMHIAEARCEHDSPCWLNNGITKTNARHEYVELRPLDSGATPRRKLGVEQAVAWR